MKYIISQYFYFYSFTQSIKFTVRNKARFYTSSKQRIQFTVRNKGYNLQFETKLGFILVGKSCFGEYFSLG